MNSAYIFKIILGHCQWYWQPAQLWIPSGRCGRSDKYDDAQKRAICIGSDVQLSAHLTYPVADT